MMPYLRQYLNKYWNELLRPELSELEAIRLTEELFEDMHNE